jgi:periplasmic copper chaperone A
VMELREAYRLRRAIQMAAYTYICVLLGACGGPSAPIQIKDAWAPATAPGATVGAAYMRIEAREADTLVGFASPIANTVELHRTAFEEGIAQMRKVDSVIVSADTPLVLEPSGLHLMLQGLSAPLEAGSSIHLTLQFRNAGDVTAEIHVMAAGAHPEHH